MSTISSSWALERVPVWRSGLALTRLGLGTVPLGAKYQAVSEHEAAETVRAALRAGITWFDTSPRYGFGVAERRLGRAFAGVPREQYVLATKVGWRIDPAGARWPDFTRDGARRSLEGSLARLGVERVDMAMTMLHMWRRVALA